MYNYQEHGADESKGPTFLPYWSCGLKVSFLVHRAGRPSELLLIRLYQTHDTGLAHGMLCPIPPKVNTEFISYQYLLECAADQVPVMLQLPILRQCNT